MLQKSGSETMVDVVLTNQLNNYVFGIKHSINEGVNMEIKREGTLKRFNESRKGYLKKGKAFILDSPLEISNDVYVRGLSRDTNGNSTMLFELAGGKKISMQISSIVRVHIEDLVDESFLEDTYSLTKIMKKLNLVLGLVNESKTKTKPRLRHSINESRKNETKLGRVDEALDRKRIQREIDELEKETGMKMYIEYTIIDGAFPNEYKKFIPKWKAVFTDIYGYEMNIIEETMVDYEGEGRDVDGFILEFHMKKDQKRATYLSKLYKDVDKLNTTLKVVFNEGNYLLKGVFNHGNKYSGDFKKVIDYAEKSGMEWNIKCIDIDSFEFIMYVVL